MYLFFFFCNLYVKNLLFILIYHCCGFCVDVFVASGSECLFPSECRMAKLVGLIKDVTHMKEMWKLQVRIEDMWSVYSKVNEKHLEILMLDREVQLNTHTIVTSVQI